MAADGSHLVSVGWLEQNINRADLLILDASPAQIYRAQHIPGALNVDLFSYGAQKLQSPKWNSACSRWVSVAERKF